MKRAGIYLLLLLVVVAGGCAGKKSATLSRGSLNIEGEHEDSWQRVIVTGGRGTALRRMSSESVEETSADSAVVITAAGERVALYGLRGKRKEIEPREEINDSTAMTTMDEGQILKERVQSEGTQQTERREEKKVDRKGLLILILGAIYVIIEIIKIKWK